MKLMFNEVELFIARRMGVTSATSKEGAEQLERSVMQRVATVAVALSLIVMIITLAVIFGFKREVHRKLTALSGEVVVTTTRGTTPSADRHLVLSESVFDIAERAAAAAGCRVLRVTPYATLSAVAQGVSGVDGVVLKGVDSTYDMTLFEEGLIEGELPKFGGEGSRRNVIISSELASKLELEVGGRLSLLVGQGADGDQMRRDLYRVGAIYTAGLGSAERGVVIADIRNVQRLNGWSEEWVSGYEVSLSELGAAPEVANAMNREMIFSVDKATDNMAAFSAQELYPGVFDWLAAHDINGVVVVVVMLVVAIFNIITALLIMVMERSRMIGVLKALGMSSRAIGRIFIYRALVITLRGMAWGNGIGLLLAWMQRRFEIIRLDEEGYMLSSVPIEFGFGWWLWLNVAVVATVLLCVVAPARLVSRVEPHKAIKFQ